MKNGDATSDEIIFDVRTKELAVNGGSQVRRSYSNGSSDSFSFKRKKKILTKEEYEELERIYSAVVVNDYDDEYHLSEEERKKKFRYYEAFAKLIRCKRKYRKLDEFVTVYRMCIDCLKIVAENNGIYTPEKFTKMVLKGDIEVFGLHFPKYVGKDKKDVNWEYISDFIMDYSKDPKELMKGNNSLLSDIDEDELEEMLFSKEELDRLKEIIDNPEEGIFMPFDEDDIKEDQEDVVVVADRDDTKKLVSQIPEVVKYVKDAVRDQRRNNARNSRLNSFVFEMTQDDFDRIEQIDRERGYMSESDIPKFTGDIMSDKDYKKYMYQLSVFENENIKENYNGKMKSLAEIREIELKNALEQAGWNVRNLYNNREKEKKLKQARKRDKKQEEKLRKKLVEIQERNKKRYGDKKKKNKDIEFDAKKKGKKKKKNKESD